MHIAKELCDQMAARCATQPDADQHNCTSAARLHEVPYGKAVK